MEVILLKDVEKLGTADTLVKVKNGYGRNYLIPQGMAIIASPANRNAHTNRLQQTERRESKLTNEFKAIVDKITGTTLTITTKAGTSGKIFGSVTTVQILSALKEVHGVEIERKKITLNEEVKNVGNYTARVQLNKEVGCNINFEVVGEA